MNKYDIYMCDFIFEEDLLTPNPRHKMRPALVLNDDILIAIVKITSKDHTSKNKRQYAIVDWKQAGLYKPSYIDFSRKLLVSRKDAKTYVGHLSANDIQNIKSFGYIVESLLDD